ncbi:WD40-repeat-containing domain protein [Aspergillus unguis]
MEMGSSSYSRYSASPGLLGSDDPSMVKESEDLLSKFMRGPSQEAQGNHLQPVRNQKTSTESVDRAQPSKPRVKIPRGNVQLRPQSIPRRQSGAGKATPELAPKPKQTVALRWIPQAQDRPQPIVKPPISRRKPTPQSPSPGLSSSGLLSPESESPQPAVIRRSGRVKTEPINYYRKLKLYNGSDSEEDVQRSLPRRQRNHNIPSVPKNSGSWTARRRDTSLSCLLRHREMGRSPSSLYAEYAGHFKSTKSWKGASNDVVSLAWSPDGTRFAAGATAQCDEHMMAYNRKNNLLLGNLVNNELHELPDHSIEHPHHGGSASHVGNDPRLFMSVTAVQWFNDTLYTASYDQTVKLWDVSRDQASCYKTLKHDSKVIVMARSNSAKNLLATGTHTIGFWDTQEARYTPLEFPRAKSRKDIELVPTSIAWGSHQATKDYLLAGMSEKEDGVAQVGLLAAFRFREASVEPVHFSPNSQNVFDVAWHPALPIFATACSAGQQVSRGTRSAVNLFDPLKLRRRFMELECPALDINETVFCHLNTNYVSAGCTDGTTYVWDIRKDGEILHVLKHGEPLNQLDENLSREQADTGVSMQLWGNTLNEFYTGASDGVVKKWDILRAPEDVLVEDVVCLKEGVMCGMLSPDQSNLLVGDVSGGIHLLSDSPFPPDGVTGFYFKERQHMSEQELEPDSGVRLARELISSAQIEEHPVFGPGQGPRYMGPFAAWARPLETTLEQIAATPLGEYWEAQQLSGKSPKHRKNLDVEARDKLERHILLARIRNQKRGHKKRAHKEAAIPEAPGNFIDLCSDSDGDYKVSPKRRGTPGSSNSKGHTHAIETIDLTGDSDAGSIDYSASSVACPILSPRVEEATTDVDDVDKLEDDFWWPDSGSVDPNFVEE